MTDKRFYGKGDIVNDAKEERARIRLIKKCEYGDVGQEYEMSYDKASDLEDDGLGIILKEDNKKAITPAPSLHPKNSIPCIDTDALKEERAIQEVENCKENEINWLNEDYWDSWNKIKGHCKKLWGNGEKYADESLKWFFLAHYKDTIRGKPQLIENVQKKIPLVRLIIKKKKDKETKEELESKTFKFFDEKFDDRYDGFQKDAFALDFWLYKIVWEGKDYFIFSQQVLPTCTCNFKGMLIELNDFAEISKSMKLKSLSRVFFMKECEPDVRILTKEQLITYTKERKIGSDDWLNFLAYHPQGTYNIFPEEVNFLRSAFILSGKVDGYPMHLFIIGKAGTKKSMGHEETLAYKFSEDFSILEGGNSRIKGLTPSFKEKPANIGYLLKAERIGLIDEIGKMIEFEYNKHDLQTKNILGDINPILEHKNRLAVSGNDNDVIVQATAKFMFVTNPMQSKSYINEHIGLIDPTTMSRVIVWVQDEAETKFLLSPESISKTIPYPLQPPVTPSIQTKIPQDLLKKQFPPTHSQDLSTNIPINKIKNKKGLGMCWGEFSSREEFLTLFDTCYSFISQIDDSKVEKVVSGITMLAKEPMKSSIWKPRGFHHTKLLIDGLCKHRCLFKDYDSTFTAKEEDYNLAEKILIRMVKSWETDLSTYKWEGNL